MAVNFYAKLKQLFSGCDTSYIEPLSYIKQFLIAESTHSEKIVLLYKKVRQFSTDQTETKQKQ